MKPISLTAGGKPQINSKVLEKLSGAPFNNPPSYGKAYDYFLNKTEAITACKVLHNLATARSTEKLINNYLHTLRLSVCHNERIHCSLNLNTNTGRISSRSPNLQNQPAYDKDIYRIRKAFCASKGNKLVVADYSQIELRVLAHISNCKAMIKAFESGDDFHSLTAMIMFPSVRLAVESGEIIISRSESNGVNDGRLTIKEKFSAERRKAKIFNFSVIYGKTVYGFSKDFGMTSGETKGYLDLWYKERPEVKEWQLRIKEIARETGFVRTIMGRYRTIKDICSKNCSRRSHAERMAVNTPIQGGAADIVMMAMLKISDNERLREIKWRMLLQVHDEIILEGPEEYSSEAMLIVGGIMRNPFEEGLRVSLEISIGVYDNWFDGK